MTKYYLIYGTRLVKGERNETASGLGLVSEAFFYTDHHWETMDPNEINDRIMGYDPSEDGSHRIGNIDVMRELQEITEEEAVRLMKR